MKINLGANDRVLRGVAGGVLIVVGLALFRRIFGIVLALVGAVLIFSATLGFCHVYKVLHIDTSKKA